VPRRKVTIGLIPITNLLTAAGSERDPTHDRVLDAAAELMAAYGLKRWSIEDVAERAEIGRTSVYRAFATRDDLVHAVLARELRQTLDAVRAAGNRHTRLEDQVIEGAMTALAALRDSLVEKLLLSDPDTFLPFLTTRAGPLIALARQVIVESIRSAGLSVDDQQTAEAAEVAARLGLSFILTRETVFPADDADSLRESLRRLLGPVLAPLVRRKPA
jgi:AcrR family transcriptional regulator